ncbi:LpqN/LpqT family lipoprotein [Mycolicibacterium crocinum]|uniref:LpqN/LpqT family lipoprotein n=1 Tax=Mycolicibacterium crocinum TaxID=388459 RepID=A0ABY3TL50_9MYCO|nr:LpqN/LpqT family lipoprotein [Mycolicibacterium crocinum]ULN40604.1 LpqN/LpqT family lipoprotein [Mycolicibacterium crocinum]
MRARRAALSLTLAMTVAACGTTPPDYSSIWSTPATTTASSPTTSAKPQPIAEYLYGAGVMGEQIPLDKLTDISVTLPRPPGWTKYNNSNFSPGTEVIAKNNTYPTAMVIVFKLTGNFDVGEALKHASVDAEMSQNFTKLNASTADFNGFPSSMIEGSYDLNGKRLHSYNRVVIPVTPAPAFQRYLVQLTVTTLADQAAAASDDVEAIIKGFSVTLKK